MPPLIRLHLVGDAFFHVGDALVDGAQRCFSRSTLPQQITLASVESLRGRAVAVAAAAGGVAAAAAGAGGGGRSRRAQGGGLRIARQRAVPAQAASGRHNSSISARIESHRSLREVLSCSAAWVNRGRWSGRFMAGRHGIFEDEKLRAAAKNALTMPGPARSPPVSAQEDRRTQSSSQPRSADIVKAFAPTGTLRVAINLGNSVLAQTDPRPARRGASPPSSRRARQAARRAAQVHDLRRRRQGVRGDQARRDRSSRFSRSSRCAPPRSTSPRPM